MVLREIVSGLERSGEIVHHLVPVSSVQSSVTVSVGVAPSVAVAVWVASVAESGIAVVAVAVRRGALQVLVLGASFEVIGGTWGGSGWPRSDRLSGGGLLGSRDG